jgi:hypothetical protein
MRLDQTRQRGRQQARGGATLLLQEAEEAAGVEALREDGLAEIAHDDRRDHGHELGDGALADAEMPGQRRGDRAEVAAEDLAQETLALARDAIEAARLADHALEVLGPERLHAAAAEQVEQATRALRRVDMVRQARDRERHRGLGHLSRILGVETYPIAQLLGGRP